MSRHPAENLPLAVTPPHRLLQPHRRSPGVSPDALTETAMHLTLTETDALYYHHHHHHYYYYYYYYYSI